MKTSEQLPFGVGKSTEVEENAALWAQMTIAKEKEQVKLRSSNPKQELKWRCKIARNALQLEDLTI